MVQGPLRPIGAAGSPLGGSALCPHPHPLSCTLRVTPLILVVQQWYSCCTITIYTCTTTTLFLLYNKGTAYAQATPWPAQGHRAPRCPHWRAAHRERSGCSLACRWNAVPVAGGAGRHRRLRWPPRRCL